MRDNIANLKHSSLKKTFQTIAFEELKKVYVYVIYVYIYIFQDGSTGMHPAYSIRQKSVAEKTKRLDSGNT